MCCGMLAALAGAIHNFLSLQSPKRRAKTRLVGRIPPSVTGISEFSFREIRPGSESVELYSDRIMRRHLS